jgi:hypothetical protein
LHSSLSTAGKINDKKKMENNTIVYEQKKTSITKAQQDQETKASSGPLSADTLTTSAMAGKKIPDLRHRCLRGVDLSEHIAKTGDAILGVAEWLRGIKPRNSSFFSES